MVFAKRRLLLPAMRWLYEYSLNNFRRQDRLNQVLFACIEELAIENAKLQLRIAELHGGENAGRIAGLQEGRIAGTIEGLQDGTVAERRDDRIAESTDAPTTDK